MKTKTYQACCSNCYSWNKKRLTKKQANFEAANHMKVYGHSTFILEEKKGAN